MRDYPDHRHRLQSGDHNRRNLPTLRSEPVMVMSQKKSARHWYIDAAAALLMGVPALFASMSADVVAGPIQQTSLTQTSNSQTSFTQPVFTQTVFPRAGVSSEAYSTPQPLQARRAPTPQYDRPAYYMPNRGDVLPSRTPATTVRTPSALSATQTAAARPISSAGNAIQQIGGRRAQRVSAKKDNKQSIKGELQRLYEQEGREMPNMPTPRFEQKPAVNEQAGAANNATSNNAAPAIVNNDNSLPPATRKEKKKAGLLAGLFDFGRKNRSSRRSYGRSGTTMQPPVEPAPFKPRTYRQQPPRTAMTPAAQAPAAKRSTAQAPATRAPQTGTAQSKSPASRQPATAQSTKSPAMIALKKDAPQKSKYDFSDDMFFPADTAETAVAQPAQADAFGSMADLFPEDTAAVSSNNPTVKPSNKPAVNAAANSLKAKVAELLASDPASAERQTASTMAPTVQEGFQMPTLIDNTEELVPQLAPGAVSDVATTYVAPLPPTAGLTEPAPFFADEERAIDPNEMMDIADLTGQTFAPSGADSSSTAGTVAQAPESGSRMQQIAARDGVGLKGFCPVSLRDDRALKDGKAAFLSFYRSKAYYFSSAETKAAFDDAPERYAPAADGQDVTMISLTGEMVDGSLEHSVWYQDRLYLFDSAENLKTFMAAPGAMVVE